MRFKIVFSAVFLTSSLFTFSCGDAEIKNNNQSANVPNTNTATNTNSESILGTTKTPEAATTNDAPTLTPVVEAYCEAIIKKDEANLRRIQSQETLKVYEKDMKDENKTSLVEFLSDVDPITDAKECVARNEKIEGDKAFAEVRNENAPNGVILEFVKEDGEWKLTNKSKDSVLDSAK